MSTTDLPDDSGGQAGDGRSGGTVAGAGEVDHLLPLSNELITAVLDARGYYHGLDDDGDVGGTWDGHPVFFFRLGPNKEVFQVRITANRTFPIDEVPRLHAFANEWNHERYWPKAYVHVRDDGQAIVVGEVVTDLSAGVTVDQLDQLIDCGIGTGLQLASAVVDL